MLRTNEILKSAPEFFAADLRPTLLVPVRFTACRPTWPPDLAARTDGGR